MIFDSFGPAARAVVMGAQREARTLGHNYVGTEHLLFALLVAERNAGGGTLTGHGVTLDAAREEAAARSESWVTDADALRAVGIDPAAVTGQARRNLDAEVAVHGHTPPSRPAGVPADAVPFTPRVRRVFEMAAAGAKPGGVGPDGILGAILDEGAGLAPIVLEHLGVSLAELRAQLGN